MLSPLPAALTQTAGLMAMLTQPTARGALSTKTTEHIHVTTREPQIPTVQIQLRLNQNRLAAQDKVVLMAAALTTCLPPVTLLPIQPILTKPSPLFLPLAVEQAAIVTLGQEPVMDTHKTVTTHFHRRELRQHFYK